MERLRGSASTVGCKPHYPTPSGAAPWKSHDFSRVEEVKSDPWSIVDGSINEAGCIYTCQGLELDYVDMVIGDEFNYRDGEIVVFSAFFISEAAVSTHHTGLAE